MTQPFHRYRSVWEQDELMRRLRRIRHVALDMDGTIYMGMSLFPYTQPFLKSLREMGIGYSFLTNNPSKCIADYLHAQGYSFSWIPYYGSRGYDDWRFFGFDQVYLQPNYYWKPANAWEDVCGEIARYGVGMELEFEPTLLHGRPDSEAFRTRFRAYMEAARRYGIYGSKPFAYYHGTNGFHDLWASDDEEDRALFRELCAFILGNPLRAAQTPEEKKNNKPNTKQQPNL